MHRKTLIALAAMLAAAGLVACGGSDDDDDDNDNTPPPQAVGDTIALTASGRIVSFNRAAPATLVGTVAVSGLISGETLLGIDIRPADGRVHALASSGTLYTIDPATGRATLLSTLRAASGDDNPFTALAGTNFAVDFNPAADRLRVVSDSGQNLRINVTTGDTTTDGTIALPGASAAVSAAAYTNAFAGASTTQLFDLDVAAGTLNLQSPPNDGTLGVGLPLGVRADGANGFDIDARNNVGYAALTIGGVTSLYTVDLMSGAATVVAGGAIGSNGTGAGESIRGLALVQPPAPTAIGLAADNRLLAFVPSAPNTITATTAITGLQSGEVVLGIDFRPSDGKLYALVSGARLYTVDPDSGVATFKVALAADPADTTAPFTTVADGPLSVDFNPFADRLRVIAASGQNLRINADTGATTTDGTINRVGAPPTVVAAAYSNNFAGTPRTSLFDLEANSGVLALQDPPNNGTLNNVGALGVDISVGGAAFDIAGGGNGLALAALRKGSSGPMTLYAVNLTSGTATLYGGLTADAALVGGASGAALIDLAIRY
jgi:hypothetical protein